MNFADVKAIWWTNPLPYSIIQTQLAGGRQMNIGAKIKAARAAANITQEQAAEQLGVTPLLYAVVNRSRL